ncbi:MAG: hypothetical protein Q9P01_10495 [Anaerolineae bacterium]|nr:hypothetical protein [Anaerolineae bacterium]
MARICELFGDFYNHSPSESLILNGNSALVEAIGLHIIVLVTFLFLF